MLFTKLITTSIARGVPKCYRYNSGRVVKFVIAATLLVGAVNDVDDADRVDIGVNDSEELVNKYDKVIKRTS